MTIKVFINLSAIDFSKTLGVWNFGKQLISALRDFHNLYIIGLKPADGHPLREEQQSLFNEIVDVHDKVGELRGVELLLHHFQKPLSDCRSLAIFHDLHLWDVPWKYGNAIAQ